MSLVFSASWESGVLKCPQGHLTYSQAWDLTAACSSFQPSQASFKGNLTLTYRFHLFSFFRIISNSYTMPQTLLSENKSEKSSLDPLSMATICSVYVCSKSNQIQEQGAHTGCLCFLINYSILNLFQTAFCSRIGYSCSKTFTSLGLKDPRFSCCFLPASPCQGVFLPDLSVLRVPQDMVFGHLSFSLYFWCFPGSGTLGLITPAQTISSTSTSKSLFGLPLH